MKADNIVIYTDMDGTVLSDWDRGPYIPERNLKMLRDFRAKGGLFSVASGRDALSILKYFPEGIISAPLVCSNGALVYDADRMEAVHEVPLPESYAQEAVEYCRIHKNVSIVTCDADGMYHVNVDERRIDADGRLRNGISCEKFLSGRYLKICFILNDAAYMEQMIKDSADFASSGLVTTCGSGPIFLEAISAGVSKAEGIKTALKYAEAQNRVLVCIGDYYNDCEMLANAHIAACPEQSPQDLKDICKFICCNNNEGAVGDLIQKLYDM